MELIAVAISVVLITVALVHEQIKLTLRRRRIIKRLK